MRVIIKIIIILVVMQNAVYSQSIDSVLTKSYKYKSKILLDIFFTNWKNSFVYSDSTYINKNDTIKELYLLINEFYNTCVYDTDMKFLYDCPISAKKKYFVMNDSVQYWITDTSEFPINNDWRELKLQKYTIKEFRPFQKFDTTEILYLNPEYYLSMVDFFKPIIGNYLPYYSDDYNKCAKVYFERIKHLSDYLIIIHNCDHILSPKLRRGGVLSYPVLDFIIFNNDFTLANIYYSMPCGWLGVQFRKQNGKWIEKETICLMII
jgi:hypothetical protein